MLQDDFRIFLSAVTSEFGRARDIVAADLRARGLTVRVQSDFRQEPGRDTTVWRDHDYVRDCDAVICIVGKRSGFVPSPAATAPFAHLLPDGITAASYTQWELFAARHYGKRLSIYIAGDDYAPDLERYALHAGNVHRRLVRRGQARRGALPGQGLTHLFSSGRGLCNARGLRVSGGGAD